jgi:gamma-glutamyltranspeptidase
VKEDGSLVTVGDLLVNPKLGATFRAIQADPMTFYNGPLAQDIVDDIKEYGLYPNYWRILTTMLKTNVTRLCVH